MRCSAAAAAKSALYSSSGVSSTESSLRGLSLGSLATSAASALSTALASASVSFPCAEAFPPTGVDMGALTLAGGASCCNPVLCGTTGSSLAGVPCSVPPCLKLASPSRPRNPIDSGGWLLPGRVGSLNCRECWVARTRLQAQHPVDFTAHCGSYCPRDVYCTSSGSRHLGYQQFELSPTRTVLRQNLHILLYSFCIISHLLMYLLLGPGNKDFGPITAVFCNDGGADYVIFRFICIVMCIMMCPLRKLGIENLLSRLRRAVTSGEHRDSVGPRP